MLSNAFKHPTSKSSSLPHPPVWLSATLLLSLYPIHPVSFTLSLSSPPPLLFKPILSGRGLVRVVRISTYKVGWKEWGRNCHTCRSGNPSLLLLFLPGLSTSLLFYSAYQRLNSTPNLFSYLPHHFYPSHLLVCFSCSVFEMFCGLPPLRLIGRSAYPKCVYIAKDLRCLEGYNELTVSVKT